MKRTYSEKLRKFQNIADYMSPVPQIVEFMQFQTEIYNKSYEMLSNILTSIGKMFGICIGIYKNSDVTIINFNWVDENSIQAKL